VPGVNYVGGRVNSIVLAEAAPGGAVGPVHLNNRETGIHQLAAKAGAERTGALDGKDRRVPNSLVQGTRSSYPRRVVAIGKFKHLFSQPHSPSVSPDDHC